MDISGALLNTVVPPEVDDGTKAEWNKYVLWLEKKGLKGHASLDSGDNGLRVLEAYRKENPSTTLTKETVPVIQQGFQQYRAKALADIKAGKASGPEDPDNNFMPGLSKIDGIPGSMTTSYMFPEARLTKIVTAPSGKVESKVTDSQGFARNK